jgi:hypothetical protein
MPDLSTITDALRAAQARGELPTSLGTAELRELGADVLSRSVFSARGSNALFVDAIKRVTDAMAAGDMDEATARVTLLETLRAVGYTPEGGFPDAPAGSVPPAVRGTLQDLSSFRRLKLIVETQRALMRGKGQQMRGQSLDRLATFPAWELVRVIPVDVPRDWPARWAIVGGTLEEGRMIALKGDPIWGELGSYDNFDDALGVDHPPFAFNSGMGWREISNDEVQQLGITGPDGETPEEWQEEQPVTLSGKLPAPVLSTRKMDPEIRKAFEKRAEAETVDGVSTPRDRAQELRDRMKKRLDDAVQRRQTEYEGRPE